MALSKNFYKKLSNTNPLLSNIFCADPTGIEYDGRLYIYGTNDHQQYEVVGNCGKNTYEAIKSLVCFSTEDMVNWTYHGCIDVEAVAPWIISSWAPSVCSRVEEDGQTHFYLYFSNSGCGVGVLTSTNPLGPWTSPLDYALITDKIPGVENVPTPFDPGVVIDDKGNGYLAFGGGSFGDDSMPGTVRIAKLGRDMISVDGKAVEIKAPYFFESSELNFIDGYYIYTFNSNWVERKVWNYQQEKSTQCSMNYMISKTPMVTDSWKYCGNYFKNPGDQGLNYSNNHTHFLEYKGQNYLFYHTLTLQEDMPTNGGFRSICADKLSVETSDDGVEIKMCEGTRKGVDAVGKINPYKKICGTTMVTSADIEYEGNKIGEEIASKSVAEGAWLLVKNVDFGAGVEKLSACVKGKGGIYLCLDKVNSKPSAEIYIDENVFVEKEVNFLSKVKGIHDVYFVFKESNICLRNWLVK